MAELKGQLQTDGEAMESVWKSEHISPYQKVEKSKEVIVLKNHVAGLF